MLNTTICKIHVTIIKLQNCAPSPPFLCFFSLRSPPQHAPDAYLKTRRHPKTKRHPRRDGTSRHDGTTGRDGTTGCDGTTRCDAPSAQRLPRTRRQFSRRRRRLCRAVFRPLGATAVFPERLQATSSIFQMRPRLKTRRRY